MGPFSESDLLQKLKVKEFDHSAFVYTDGMANWEALSSVDVLMKPSLKPASAFTSDSGVTGDATMTMPVSPTLKLGGNIDEQIDVDVKYSESSAAPDMPSDSPELESPFENSGFMATESPSENQSSASEEFVMPQLEDGIGDANIESAADSWGSDPVPESTSADPLQVESLGSSFELPSQVDEFGAADSALAETPAASLAPAGEFVELAQAGEFPEDEAHLSKAGQPVAKSKTSVQGGKRKLPFLAKVVLVLAAVFAFGILAIQHTPLGKIAQPTVQLFSEIVGFDFVKALGLSAGDKSQQTAAQTSADPSNPNNPTGAATTPVVGIEKVWTDLSSYKAADNGEAPPVRLATENLMGSRPILVGVVSPMVMADRKLKKLRVAIFPDGERSLVIKPWVWIKEIPLYGEYFSIGPLSLDGQPLPVGVYHVMFRGDNTEMGAQTFQIGPWPSETELAAKMKELENQRVLAAGDERKVLDQNFNTLVGLTAELEKNGREKGIQPGMSARKSWLAFSQSWLKSYQDLGENLRPTGDYRFYADAHASMDNYYKSLKRVYLLTEAYSNGGAKAFAKASKMSRYTDLLIANTKQKDDVKSVLLELEKQAVAVPKIDSNQVDKIKAILMGD